MRVGVFCFGLVVPFFPFGLPGKRFWFVVFWLLWSPVLVGYLRRAEGVCGFSCRSRARFSLLFSVFRIRFSSCSCLSCWQVWLQWIVVVVVVDIVGQLVVVVYGSRRTALTFFSIHSLGTSMRAEVAQGLAVFSMTS